MEADCSLLLSPRAPAAFSVSAETGLLEADHPAIFFVVQVLPHRKTGAREESLTSRKTSAHFQVH